MLLTILLFLFQIAPTAQPTATPVLQTQTPTTTTTTTSVKTAAPSPVSAADEVPRVTHHSIRAADGKTLNYTVTTGFMPIRNSVTSETEARIFFMAYTLDNQPNAARRPLMFSFNGGPGSSSVWLHLGALGPKRVKMMPDGMMPPPPYELVENPQTWLADTDLVFIDPVGTGYSRAAKPEVAAKFFSLQGDVESVGEFIRLYLSRNSRWSSPIYLVGESYGTTRASALSNYLFEKGVGLNGVLLISSVMNFQTARFAEGNDMAYELIFPSYTATAWYHKKLPADLQSKPLRDVLRESEDFVSGELMTAMAKGDRLTAEERRRTVDKYARLSGLRRDFVEQNNMRVELSQFNKELLRDARRSTGRLDSRFTGIDRSAGGDSPDTDPSMSAIRPPYTATFNDYVRRDLGFESDLEYYILGGGIGQWNWNTNNGYANTAISLRAAMSKNPYMKIFVASGYYDMATPYFATEYTLAGMNLDPSLRRNITTAFYESGHMMYIEENSLRKLKQDVSAFLQSSAKK